jgi:site-specific DNA-cytosine methylase
MGFFIMENTGQIVRSKKTGKSKYTPISNEILQSGTLTPEEKSILVHLLSLPDDWVVYKTIICNEMNMGKHRFNAHWKTLVEKGYIVSIRVIDAKTNLVKGWNHIVYEEPVLSDCRTYGNPDSTESGQYENHVINKRKIKQKNNKTKETSQSETNIELPIGWENAFNQWLNHKKEKKQSYKTTGLEQLKKKILNEYETLEHFEKSVQHCIAQNYNGLFPLKEINKPKQQTESPYKQLNFD